MKFGKLDLNKQAVARLTFDETTMIIGGGKHIPVNDTWRSELYTACNCNETLQKTKCVPPILKYTQAGMHTCKDSRTVTC